MIYGFTPALSEHVRNARKEYSYAQTEGKFESDRQAYKHDTNAKKQSPQLRMIK